jgi:hypothetical protein
VVQILLSEIPRELLVVWEPLVGIKSEKSSPHTLDVVVQTYRAHKCGEGVVE